MNWTQSGFRKDISTIFEPSLVTTFVLDLEMALTRKEVKEKILHRKTTLFFHRLMIEEEVDKCLEKTN